MVRAAGRLGRSGSVPAGNFLPFADDYSDVVTACACRQGLCPGEGTPVFVFVDTPVKFIGLLVLFVWCTGWSTYELTRPQDGRRRVSSVLHLAMAVVMLLMVAPLTWRGLVAVVPVAALTGFFGLCTVWFVWLAVEATRAMDPPGRMHRLGHAAMFGAMTWHLSAMTAMHAVMSRAGSGVGQGREALSRPGGTLWIFAVVGIPFMAYLLVSSLRSLSRSATTQPRVTPAVCPCGPGCSCGPECSCWANHAEAGLRSAELVASSGAATGVATAPKASTANCHEVRVVGTLTYRLAALSDFAMSFGMFWMSSGLLVPVLPFFVWFSV